MILHCCIIHVAFRSAFGLFSFGAFHFPPKISICGVTFLFHMQYGWATFLLGGCQIIVFFVWTNSMNSPSQLRDPRRQPTTRISWSPGSFPRRTPTQVCFSFSKSWIVSHWLWKFSEISNAREAAFISLYQWNWRSSFSLRLHRSITLFIKTLCWNY